MTWGDCGRRRRRSPRGCARGVGPGDRVAAYMPNIPETVAALLACASLGAVWSSAAPEFGAGSVIDRFSQIEPKVLLAVDGYRYGGQGLRPVGLVQAYRRRDPDAAARASAGVPGGSGWPTGFPTLGALSLGSSALQVARRSVRSSAWVCTPPARPACPSRSSTAGRYLLEQLKVALHLDARPVIVFLVHDDRLDHVELPRRGALHRCVDRLFDGNPGYPRSTRCGISRRTGRDDASAQARRSSAACMKERVVAPEAATSSGCARGVDRLASCAGGVPLGLRPARVGSAVLDLRRPRPVHLVRRRRADAPSTSASYRPRAGRIGRGLGRRRRPTDRSGRGARDHPADAVDAMAVGMTPGERYRESYFDPNQAVRATPVRFFSLCGAVVRMNAPPAWGHGDHKGFGLLEGSILAG